MTSANLKLILAVTLISVTISAGQCAGGVIAYNNFRADVTYPTSNYYDLGFRSSHDLLGQRFTPGASGVISEIELGLLFRPPSAGDQFSANVDELTLAVAADVDGKPGAEVLWSQFYAKQVPVNFGDTA